MAQNLVTIHHDYIIPKQQCFQLSLKLSVARTYMSCRKDDGLHSTRVVRQHYSFCE